MLIRPSKKNGKRYMAFFGELVYECDGLPYYLSTNVRIVDWERPPAADKAGAQ